MKYGISKLTLIPIRTDADHRSEMVSQLLFGELYKVIQPNKHWLKVKCTHDACEGWIDIKQHTEIEKEDYSRIKKSSLHLTNQLIDILEDQKTKALITVLFGSSLPNFNENQLSINGSQYGIEGAVISGIHPKGQIINTALMYENSPFLWGGKTPFGIDAAGFTQMVYKLNGYALKRSPEAQATQGEVLSFIEESEPGDLAFFDDQDGQIIHVGIILKNHHIIHVDGKVRVDRLDQSGIFNPVTKKHTHKLRMIKKII